MELRADAVAAKTYRAPKTREEKALCEIWAEVLGLERVGLDDNFFAFQDTILLMFELAEDASDDGLSDTCMP